MVARTSAQVPDSKITNVDGPDKRQFLLTLILIKYLSLYLGYCEQ